MWGYIQAWHETWLKEAQRNDRDAPKQKGLQGFLGIINCLNKFSPSTADVCEAHDNWHQSKQRGPGIRHTKNYLTSQNQS